LIDPNGVQISLDGLEHPREGPRRDLSIASPPLGIVRLTTIDHEFVRFVEIASREDRS
jgi:hypothetical protein